MYIYIFFFFFFIFFFKQKTAYEIVSRDWSSDVCSSDLKYHCIGIFFIVTVSTEVNGSMWAVDYWALLASEVHMNVSTQISDRLRLIYILGHQCYDCRYNIKTCMNIISESVSLRSPDLLLGIPYFFIRSFCGRFYNTSLG